MRQSAIAARIRRLATMQIWRYPKAWNGIARSLPRAPLIRPALSLVLLTPLIIWLLATVYVPITAPFMSEKEAWFLSLVIASLLVGSLALHTAAHRLLAHVLGATRPARVTLYIWGDAAQVWPTAPTATREAIIAIAGPTMNGILAAAAYLVWDMQRDPYLNTSMLLLALANIAMAVLNLAPGFPLDGGRLARAIIWALVRQPVLANRIGLRFGRWIVCMVALWGIVLMVQPARFSIVAGGGTVSLAMLLAMALRHRCPLPDSGSTTGKLRYQGVRWLSTACLLIPLLAISISLLPLTQGVRIPGEAVAVEQMVRVPPEYRHPVTGSFLLTTAIDQTPITAGQWLYATLQPSHDILPPEVIIPRGTTPQSAIQRSYRLLESSERAAAIVAQRIAGVDTTVVGVIIEIVAIDPESWAYGVLQPGDQIVRIDSEPIASEDGLWKSLLAAPTGVTRELEIRRRSQVVTLRIPVTSAIKAGTLSDFGWHIQRVGYNTESPFGITITPRKVVGGPSAGLMFALATYNLITPDDLTGGYSIAGTGTIDLDGRVGPIGAVKQKVAAAERAGAHYFLAPSANAEDARRVAQQIKVLEIESIEQAIEMLRSLPSLDYIE